MKTCIHAILVAVSIWATAIPARAQSLATELDVTTGFSSEDGVAAAASQLRVFGEVGPKIQFNVEGTWARRSGDGTDAFGAAYPYGNRLQLGEAYGERTFQSGPVVTSVRGGQYRTPFGIYSRADYGYSGFLRAPLVRYEGYWSVMNTMLERGVNVAVGTHGLSVEASLGAPGDLGEYTRRSGLDSVVRAQGYYKALIVGVSHISSEPYGPISYAKGQLTLTGIDARWTLGGVQLRGEWMTGQPWNGPSTTGGYVDAIVHRPSMGPVTVVFRTERLDYSSSHPFTYHGTPGFYDWQGTRHTVGGRIRLPGHLTAQINLIRQSELLAAPSRTAFDVAMSYSIRSQH